MQRNLFFKLVVLASLSLLVLIPLNLLEGLVRERAALRSAAQAEIAKGWSGPQKVRGPVLLVPYNEKHIETAYLPEEEGTVSRVVKRQLSKKVVPSEIRTSSVLSVEERSLGVYRFPIYLARLQIDAKFDLPPELTSETGLTHTALILGLSDPSAIQGAPSCSVLNTRADLVPGAASLFEKGVSAQLPVPVSELPSQLHIQCELEFRGSASLAVLPNGKSAEISISGNWPHVNLSSSFMPAERKIDSGSFSSIWKVSSFAQDWAGSPDGCGATQESCSSGARQEAAVSMLTPVDIYTQVNRSVKYASLFCLLTFTAFFLFEILKKLRIHPVQYGLVAMALSAFYLLLLSLSEHIGFGASYLTAAAACISLIAVYVRAVLATAARTAGFCGGLALLYASLYIVLQSEDFALLMGSSILFGVLSLFMITTRNINWYEVGRSREV
ncbi:MAG: cell envelope integrity protein CreD [Deltaproteobacteria bacterium]|nr:cell envelope integrity protein CreD [Deltaproteobacteria bacterium]